MEEIRLTSWYGKYPSIHRVFYIYISTGARFLPSTVTWEFKGATVLGKKALNLNLYSNTGIIDHDCSATCLEHSVGFLSVVYFHQPKWKLSMKWHTILSLNFTNFHRIPSKIPPPRYAYDTLPPTNHEVMKREGVCFFYNVCLGPFSTHKK